MANREGGSQFQRPCQYLLTHHVIPTKFQAASFPAPGRLSLMSSCSVGSCCVAFADNHAGSALSLLLSADLCLFQKLPPVTSAGKYYFPGICSLLLLLLYSIGPGFSRSLPIPTLGPHVLPKSTSIVRPWGTGSVLERMLSGAQYLQTVPVPWDCDPKQLGDISNLFLWLLLLEEGLR